MRVLKEAFTVHETLNPKLFNIDTNKLLPEVRDRIIEIVEEFKHYIDIPLDIVSVQCVGSNVSYNYNDTSDLDVHIIANFEAVSEDTTILQALYDAKKASFNKSLDITIHGIEIEMYVQDINSGITSNGIYDVYEDEWIKFPKPITNIPKHNIKAQYNQWVDIIKDLIKENNYDKINKAIDDLYLIRHNSIATDGEYGKGNQLFKDLRSDGFLQALKDASNVALAKKLSLESLQEHLLTEETRRELINKSKNADNYALDNQYLGKNRYERRVHSKIANSVKEFNSIDMNEFFKNNILNVNIKVFGETNNYSVKIKFGSVLDNIHNELSKNNNGLNLRVLIRALIQSFNNDDVYIHCSCPDWNYRFSYWSRVNDISSDISVEQTNNGRGIVNPNDTKGRACKHVLLVLSNNTWINKLASTIYNYINYMEKHYAKLYADIIYPALYQKEYEEPVQIGIDEIEKDDLITDEENIDTSNVEARRRGQFKPGNEYRYTKLPQEETEDQLSIEELE